MFSVQCFNLWKVFNKYFNGYDHYSRFILLVLEAAVTWWLVKFACDQKVACSILLSRQSG